MKRILIAVVLALSLLLIPSTVSAAGVEVVGETGDGTWTGDGWEVDLYPGESRNTTLTLYNSASSSLEVWVTILPDPLNGDNVTFELDESNFIMFAGSNASVTLTARASGSATPDSYFAKLEIKSEIPPAPAPRPSADNGAAPLYSIKTNLFGVERTYYTEYDGYLPRVIEGTSQDGKLTVTIPKHTTALSEDGKRLKTLGVVIDETPPSPPENTNIIGLAYDFSPVKATFDPPIIFTWKYDPDALSEGVVEEELVLAYYLDGEWVELECVVDTESNTITASVKHFTTFALIVAVPKPTPAPMPAPVPPPAPAPIPPPVVITPIPTIPEPSVVTPPVAPPIEPEAPSPEVRYQVPWGLIIGLICATVIVGLAIWLIRRRKERE